MGRLVLRNDSTGSLVGLEDVVEDCGDHSGMTVGSYAEYYEAGFSEYMSRGLLRPLSCFR